MCLNSDWSLHSCWSPMGLHRHVGLRSGMSISDGSPIQYFRELVPDKLLR